MGGAVKSISNGVSNIGKSVGRAAGTAVGDISQIARGNFNNAGNSIIRGGINLASHGLVNQNTLKGITGETGSERSLRESTPQQQGLDPNLLALQGKMIDQANQFRENLPGMKNQMGEQLQADSNKTLLGQQKQITNMNNKRGLLYGGINEGQKSEAAATAQGNLASAIRGANANLDSKADEMDYNAINVGVGVHQTQQQIQNNIYAQAQANMAANQSMFGSAASTGLLAYLLL